MIPWLQKVLLSFTYAWAGISWAMRTQRNLQIHAAATAGVLVLGCLRQVSAIEWCVLFLCIGLVWMAELFNTALEVLCDRVRQEHDERIRRVKDTAAGAVLVAAVTAAIVGIIVLL